MIARLRSGHVLRHALLAGITLVGLAFALTAREEAPTAALAVTDLEAETFEGEMVWERRSLFTELPARVTLLRGDGFAVQITPHTDPLLPDVLVYWSPRLSPEIPENAHFLGRLAGAETRTFRLPKEAFGALYLFSLGHQQLIDRADISGRPAGE